MNGIHYPSHYAGISLLEPEDEPRLALSNRGGRSFAPLLLAREREEPCEELRAVIACIARERGGDSKGAMLLLLAALGLMLSSLARLPYPLPEHASDLLDELEAAASRIGDVGLQAV